MEQALYSQAFFSFGKAGSVSLSAGSFRPTTFFEQPAGQNARMTDQMSVRRHRENSRPEAPGFSDDSLYNRNIYSCGSTAHRCNCIFSYFVPVCNPYRYLYANTQISETPDISGLLRKSMFTISSSTLCRTGYPPE